MTLVLAAGFLLTGMVAVLLGPLIPEMTPVWGVGNAAASSLFAIQFIANSVGAALSTAHERRSLLLGYAAILLGLMALASGSWALARPAMALIGLGLGLSIPVTNLRIARLHPERRGAALNTLNLVWGAGAVSCPLLFALLRGRLPGAAAPTLLAIVSAIHLLVLAKALWRAAEEERAIDEEDPPTDRRAADQGTKASVGPLLLIAVVFFFYIGIENAIGGWLPTLADQLAVERDALSMLVGASFWAALLAGRALAPLVLSRWSEAALFKAGLLLAFLGNLGLLVADHRGVLALASMLTGVGLAPLYPLAIALLAERTAASGSRNTGWVFACGGLGGGILPWLTGLLGGEEGVSSGAFVLPLIGLAVMSLAWWAASTERHPVEGDAPDPTM